MKASIQTTGECRRALKLEVPLKDILSEYDEVYADFSKTAQLSGFRQGKAPRYILEQHYSHKAKEEVLNRLISQSYQKAVKENNLAAVSYPEISEVKFENNKPLTFTATVEVKPEVKLKNYKGIKIKKKNIAVTQEEIDKGLKYFQESLALMSPVLEDRPLKEGDFLLSDIECFVDGLCIDKRQNVLLFLSAGENNEDNFSQKLFGAKVGEVKKVNMLLPQDYPQVKYASKQAEFKICLKQIKEKKLPELNGALAKAAGNYQTIDQLKEAIKQDLINNKETQSKISSEGQILAYLLEQNNFAIPESLGNKRFAYLLEEARHKLEGQGFKKDDIEKQQKTLEEKLKPEAQKQVKLFFILSKIAQAENIEVAPEEMEERYLSLSRFYGKSLEEIREEVDEHNLAEVLEEELLREKTIAFLFKEAKIEEE